MPENKMAVHRALAPPRLRACVLLLMLPLPLAAAGLSERQALLLSANCVQCHARPDIGVPLMGQAADWSERIVRGEEDMLRNVVHGLRGMPPLGYCSACTEEDFRAMIRLMAGLPDPAPGTAGGHAR